MPLRTRSRGPTWNRKTGGAGGIGGLWATKYLYNGIWHYHPYRDLANTLTTGVFSTNVSSSYGNEGETIVDETNTPKTKWKYVNHSRVRYVSRQLGYAYKRNTDLYYTVQGHSFGTPPTVLASAKPTFTDAELRQCRARSYQSLIPEFGNKDNFSGINSLWELKDLKGALKLTGKGISAISGYWTKMFSKVGTSSGLSKTAAELTLQYDFGLKPMIADVAALTSAIEDARDALKKFNSKGEAKSTHHYDEKLITYINVPTTGVMRTAEIRRKVFRAQAELTYGLDRESVSAFDNALEYYGLTLTSGRLWDMVPFSFLIDWFVTIGDSLHSLSTRSRAIPQVSRYSETYEEEVYKVSFLVVPSNSTLLWSNSSGPAPPSDILEAIGLENANLVSGWCSCTSYMRNPTNWDNIMSSPYAHVVLPELRWPFKGKRAMQKMRDGLALLRQIKR